MQPDLHLDYPDFYRAKQRLNTALLHTQMLLSLEKKKKKKAHYYSEIDALPPALGLSSAPRLWYSIIPELKVSSISTDAY